METKSLLELIATGSNERVTLLLEPPEIDEIARLICGFANSGGGYLILGVEPETSEIAGLKKAAETINLTYQAARLCKPAIDLEPAYPETYNIKGRSVVVANISERQGNLHQLNGVFWTRRGQQTIPLEAAEIEQLLYTRGIASWETKLVEEATIDDLDMALVREMIIARPDRVRNLASAESLEEVLIKLKCARRVTTAHDQTITRPTNAGMLLFGNYPQTFIIQAEISCVLYGEANLQQRYLDRRIISGTIRDMIDGAEDFFRQHVPVPARMDNFRRIDEPDYPIPVLREALVNAIVHRDYAIEGESVRVFYYPDRIEIHNPGLLLPGLSIKDLAEGRARSKLRNPVIAGVLRDLPGGYMERLGSGIHFMLQQLAILGHPRPQFSEQGEFTVTFYKKPAMLTTVSKTFSLPENRTNSVEERLDKLLQYVRENGAVTNREYRAITGLSDATSLRDFDALVQRGQLKVVGKGRARYYTLP